MTKVAEKSCGCKGIRSCLLCENGSNLVEEEKTSNKFFYCATCGNKAWRNKEHVLHEDVDNAEACLRIDGVFIAHDAVSEDVQCSLVDHMNRTSWVNSQSGRRKQDYGPKVNFKKRKCRLDAFFGLPAYAQNVFDNIKEQHPLVLADFLPVELCNLEYTPERGSAIDPHVDDFWLWGERLVTLNLLSEAVLTLTPVSPQSGHEADCEIRITMPSRSLLVLHGDARYNWNHSIKRCDITRTRIAMTWRELSERFLPSGAEYEEIGKQLLEIASRSV